MKILIHERVYWGDYQSTHWKVGGEGTVIGETETHYKVKGLFGGFWVPKRSDDTKCEVISSV